MGYYRLKKAFQPCQKKKRESKHELSTSTSKKSEIDFDIVEILKSRTQKRPKLRRNKYEYVSKLSIEPKLDTINENNVLKLEKLTPVSQDLKIRRQKKRINLNKANESIHNPKPSSKDHFFKKMLPNSQQFLNDFHPTKPVRKSNINYRECESYKKRLSLAVQIIRLFQLLSLVTILSLFSYLMALVPFNVSILLMLTIISLILTLLLLIFDPNYLREYFYVIMDTIIFALMIILSKQCVDLYSAFEIQDIMNLNVNKIIDMFKSKLNQSDELNSILVEPVQFTGYHQQINSVLFGIYILAIFVALDTIFIRILRIPRIIDNSFRRKRRNLSRHII